MLYSKETVSDTLIGIWKLEESTDELLSQLDMDANIKSILSLNSPKRVLEMLAVRVLLKEIMGNQTQIGYSDSGRPYLLDNSNQISISHTQNYISVALHPTRRVGLDIEYISNKITRIQSRVVSDEEYIDPSQEIVHLLLHWSAKEAIFKVLDETGVNYLNHLHVKHFTPQKQGTFEVQETKTLWQHRFDKVYYKIYDDFVLVCLIL